MNKNQIFPPRKGHKPGDKQRLINGKSICVDCDMRYATVFDDFCQECWDKFEMIEF